MREQRVVIFPELSLLGGALRRLGRRPRIRVIAEREVPVHEAHAIAVRVEDLRDGWVGALAERALEIRELDDLDRRVCGSLRRAVGGRHGLTRRLEEHADRRLAAQRVEKLLPRELHPLLREVLANRLADLVERGALPTRLVLLVPLCDLGIVDR